MHSVTSSLSVRCIQAVGISSKITNHKHSFYNSWSDLTQIYTVCNKPCGGSFYGSISFDFSAHVGCSGFPTYVMNQSHRHVFYARSLFSIIQDEREEATKDEQIKTLDEDIDSSYCNHTFIYMILFDQFILHYSIKCS